MPRFRKKPVIVEAIQWSGANWDEILAFASGDNVYTTGTELHVITREGPLKASEGDWIIKGVAGECYPCKPDIFEATYDEVVEPAALPTDYTEGDE